MFIEETVLINADGVRLSGDLRLPTDCSGIVVFAHGSGSSRLSPRNRLVAERLVAGGLGTLLFDLLTEEEEIIDLRSGHLRFDIPFLARRLVAATHSLGRDPRAAELPVGYFGASTGAAAALIAAAVCPTTVSAVVSRGGRPDLACDFLGDIRAPTLLIVGGADEPVLELNRKAYARLVCPKRLEVVPGATHLFEEPGALESVSDLALDWFQRYLVAPARTPQHA